LAEKDLIQIEPPRFEPMSRAIHIKPPNAISQIAGDVARLLGVLFKPANPLAQGKRVMFAKVLNVAYFEAACFSHSQSGAHRNQFAIRKNVLACKGRFSALNIHLARNTVIEEHATGRQSFPGTPEILRQQFLPYVFKHSDADNLVVSLQWIEVAIVAYLYLAVVLQSRQA